MKSPGRLRRWSFRVTARGWIYLVLAASVAFAAALKGNNLLFAIFCLLTGQFIVSGVLTVVVARGIELSRILPETAVAGEIFTVGIRLRNAKRFWPVFCLRIEDRLTAAGGRAVPSPPTPVWIPLAGPRKRIRTACYASAPGRGWVRLGPFTVTSEFTPGLFTYRRIVPVVNRLLVYPRLGLLHRRLLDPMLERAEIADFSANDFVRGQEEFSGLRDFREGDNPRKIHWKMSARLPGRLLVREHEDPRVRNAAVYLETHVPKAGEARRRNRLERAITFAATLVDTLLADGYRVRFRMFNPDPVRIELDPRGRELDDLLAALALLRPTRTGTLSDLLAVDRPEEGESLFLLRIGDDPLPEGLDLARSVVLSPSDMKSVLEESPLDEPAPEEDPS